MIEAFDKNLRRVAILQNAFDVTADEQINAIYHRAFSMPTSDYKNKYCQAFNFIRFGGGDYYRVMPSSLDMSDKSVITYTCEHAIATLIDTLLDGYCVIGGLGMYTEDVINYILSGQRHWKLGACDFHRQFEYGWEQENRLGALFSVPTLFVEKYMWTYDFTNYPWTINLIKLDETIRPAIEIREAKNMKALQDSSEPTQICTRLFPLGSGEGINQVGIASLNGGKNYIESPSKIIEKYGIIERAWTDRRYENPETLLAAAQVMLSSLQEPYQAFSIDFVDLTDDIRKKAKLGDLVNMKSNGLKALIVGVSRDMNDPSSGQITIANKPTDIAESIADLSDRQRIESTYSQGATQIYENNSADNADNRSPFEARFYIDEDMKIVNSVKCRIGISQFRTYSKATSSGGSVQSSSSGGGEYTSTSSGGRADLSGGGVITSGSTGIDFSKWGKIDLSGITTTYANGPGSHAHKSGRTYIDFTNANLQSDHQHSVNTAFNFTVPSHYHDLEIDSHSHTVDTTHGHNIEAGIFFFGSAKGFWLLINGERKQYFAQTDVNIDITQYLIKDGTIPRGQWHTIGVLPDDLARVEIAYNVRGFIQSRGGIIA